MVVAVGNIKFDVVELLQVVLCFTQRLFKNIGTNQFPAVRGHKPADPANAASDFKNNWFRSQTKQDTSMRGGFTIEPFFVKQGHRLDASGTGSNQVIMVITVPGSGFRCARFTIT